MRSLFRWVWNIVQKERQSSRSLRMRWAEDEEMWGRRENNGSITVQAICNQPSSSSSSSRCLLLRQTEMGDHRELHTDTHTHTSLLSAAFTLCVFRVKKLRLQKSALQRNSSLLCVCFIYFFTGVSFYLKHMKLCFCCFLIGWVLAFKDSQLIGHHLTSGRGFLSQLTGTRAR